MKDHISLAIFAMAIVLLGSLAMAQTAPVVIDIPDQTIAEGLTFATINLDDYISDVDNLDTEMTWNYSFDTELTIFRDINRVETITLTTTDFGMLADSELTTNIWIMKRLLLKSLSKVRTICV